MDIARGREFARPIWDYFKIIENLDEDEAEDVENVDADTIEDFILDSDIDDYRKPSFLIRNHYWNIRWAV